MVYNENFRLIPDAPSRLPFLISFSVYDSNFRFETVNINLKQKPDWFYARNPIGLVPVLEIDGKVLYESNVCNEYLDNVYPSPKLMPTDFYQACQDKMLWETFGKVHIEHKHLFHTWVSHPY